MPLASWTTNTWTAERISTEVRNAIARNTPLRIRGAGLWLDAGGPVTAAGTVSLAADARIVEYVPGDLTITALAGTTLAQINEVVGRDGQWLALDPYGDTGGTIGATIATASYGPLSHAFGTPRDQLLGVEFVTGAGDVVRGGGRVTKNVAGFDLSRLICGAWGTLGVITEVTLRLRAVPERDVTVAIPIDPSGNAGGLQQLLLDLHAATLTSSAYEVLDRGMCRVSGLEMQGAVALRFCGNESGVAAQIRRAHAAAGAEECQPGFWDRMRRSDRFDHIVFRISSRPSRLPQLWDFAAALAGRHDGARVSATVSRGVVRCSVPLAAAETIADELHSLPECEIIFERLPASLWPLLAPAHGLADPLTSRVRAAFDPQRILNPGILGEPEA